MRQRFFGILSIKQEIAKRQLLYIGKITRRENTHIPSILLSSWCNHPRRRGGTRKTNKKSVVENLQILLPEKIPSTGAFHTWIHFALNRKYWTHLLSLIGTTGRLPRPFNDPSFSNPNSTRDSHRTYAAPPPRHPTTPPRRRRRQRPPPISTPPPHASPPSPAPTPVTPPTRRTPPPPRVDLANVGRTRHDSLIFLELPFSATEREVKVRYRKLARIYHPDKHEANKHVTGLTPVEAEDHFKLINNAHEYLRNIM